MRTGTRQSLTLMLCVLSVMAMLTSGLSLDLNEELRNGTPPIELEATPPLTPLVGQDPPVEWFPFSSPNSIENYFFVEAADINTDGNQDIIVGNEGGGLSIWTGDGSGSWAAFGTPGAADLFMDIAVSDFNNDGKMDMAAASVFGILAWTGDGLGGWTSANNGLPTFQVFNSIEMADVNLDGDLDMVAGSMPTFVQKGVKVLLGDGNGNWIDGDTGIPDGFTSTGVAIGDFNRDGNPDIASSRDDGISVWTGNVSGLWTLAESGLPTSGEYSDVKMADFNQDGNLDIVGTHENNGGLAVWIGNGVDLWTRTFNLPLTGSYFAVEVGDVNLDGYIDIFTAPDNTTESIWSGDGLDDWFLQIGGLPAGMTYSDIAVVDIDNDGRLDYIGSDTSTNIGIEIWTADVFRTVNSWEAFNPPPSTSNILDVEIFDVNRDGNADICFGTKFNGIEIWTGDGTGNWAAFASPTTTGRYISVKPYDFNKDGFPDLVATSTPGIRAWTGDGAGGWTPRNDGLPTNGGFAGLTVADFNDDGNPDIAAGSAGNGGIAVWNGNGVDLWNRTFNLPFSGRYEKLSHGDVNNDGSLDLLTINGAIRIFLGDSMDGWTTSTSGLPSSDSDYTDVKFLDIDRDHILDIAASSISNGTETWLGLGDGTWTYNDQPWADEGLGLEVGDFSIDGNVDIVVGSNYSALGIGALRQDAVGWTSTSGGLPPGGQYRAMELIDINADGRMDMITRNGDSTGARIWTGTYVAPPLMPPSNLEATISGAANEDILLNWTLSPTDEDVSEYLIYRSSTFEPNGLGYTLLDSRGQGVCGYNDLGGGKGDANNYFYIIGATNLFGEWVNFTGQVAKINRPVDIGWNLFSTPVVASDASIDTTLTTVNWNYALAYDTNATYDKWVSNNTSRPDILDDLDVISHKNGIWLNVNGNDNLVTTGQVKNVTIELKAGWNLVAYPCMTGKTVSQVKVETGAISIEGFNSTNPYNLEVMQDTDTMTLGNGYWLYVSADTPWVINNYP